MRTKRLRVSLLIGLTTVGLCARQAAATEPVAAATQPAPTVLVAPRWLERPDGNDVAAIYPDRAQRAGISGKAIALCKVGGDGRLYRCRVFAEAPVGQAFGLAVLKLMPKFRVSPPTQPQPGEDPTIFIPVLLNINRAPGPKALVLVGPLWANAPSFEDMAKAFPRTARSRAADVELLCHVGSDGAVGTCAVTREPLGHEGFAEAALSLAPRFRVDMAGRPPRPDDDFTAQIDIHFTDPTSADFVRRGIGAPEWVTAPSESAATALFPAEAAARGLKVGRGVAACTVATDGTLRDCVPRPGEPDGVGFSEAAVRFAALLRMNPWTQKGGPVGGAQIELPVRFDLSSATR